MARRHQLSMVSYDRLFPNQDTPPRGGFGNPIALPLQRPAREASNTVFVDRAFRPWPDQWAFLAGVKRIEVAFAHALAEEARATDAFRLKRTGQRGPRSTTGEEQCGSAVTKSREG
jgi:hypothetical protein